MSKNTSLNSLLDIVWLKMQSIVWSGNRPATSMVQHSVTHLHNNIQSINNHICSASAFKTWHRFAKYLYQPSLCDIHRHQYKICNDHIFIWSFVYFGFMVVPRGTKSSHSYLALLQPGISMVWHHLKQKVPLVKCAFLTESLYVKKIALSVNGF